MSIRVSGLISGLDTDSIIKDLVSAYSIKKDKYVKSQTKLDWKMDAWKDMNKKVGSMYKSLGSLKLSSAYRNKETTCSDPTKAKVTAGNGALNGNQTLTIDEVATTGFITGDKLTGATEASTLESLGMAAGATGTIAVKVKGVTKNIEIKSSMTIKETLSALNSAGVKASFDVANQRMYIAAKSTGKANDFSLTGTDANGISALKSLGVNVASSANTSAYEAWKKYAYSPEGDSLSGPMLSDAEIRANLTAILENIAKYQGDSNVEGSIAKLQAKNDALKSQISIKQSQKQYAQRYEDMKEGLKAGPKDADGNLISSNLTAAEQSELEGLLYKTSEERDLDGTTARFEELKTKLDVSDEEWSKLSTNASVVQDFEKDPLNAGIKDLAHQSYTDGTYDVFQQSIDDVIADQTTEYNDNLTEIASKQAYIAKHALLTDAAPDNGVNTIDDRVLLLKDKIDFAINAMADTGSFNPGAGRVDGKDAKITLNGVEYESDSNNITVNGITITALQKTAPGETLSITTETNVQATYDTIKNFLEQYNDLVKEMDTLFSAPNSKGFEPLTDEEKSAMSDKEVEKWEQKIKDSVLRRDDTLSSVKSMMTGNMAKSFELSDGKKYSLASFGIKTQEYFSAPDHEGSSYHIDGDPENPISKDNPDQLMKMIQDNPEMVEEFFGKLTGNLYDELAKKYVPGSTIKSTFTIYNDKAMQKEYDEYTATIKKWEKKVTAMEESYYKKFTAMEVALSKLQQSTNSLSSMLGSS